MQWQIVVCRQWNSMGQVKVELFSPHGKQAESGMAGASRIAVVSSLVWDSWDPTPCPGDGDLWATSHTQTLSTAKELPKPLDMNLLASCRVYHCPVKLLEKFLFEMSKKTVHSWRCWQLGGKGEGRSCKTTDDGPKSLPSLISDISVCWQLTDSCSNIQARHKVITWKMYVYAATVEFHNYFKIIEIFNWLLNLFIVRIFNIIFVIKKGSTAKFKF